MAAIFGDVVWNEREVKNERSRYRRFPRDGCLSRIAGRSSHVIAFNPVVSRNMASL